MNSIFIVSMALCWALVGFQACDAQQPPVNGCSSAGNLGGQVWFNCDYPGPGSVSLRHRGEFETSFATVSMSPTGDGPFYASTYETAVTFADDPGTLEYFFSAVQDTMMATQSPKNSNNQFPPASYKYAHFVTDPQGDMAGGSAGNWLDLRASGMSHSDTRLYCYLGNVSGTWPLNQFLDYFAYTFGFMITSGADSTFYALVYANVPLLLSTGLYVLDRADSSYTRIGNISSSVSGGLLHMAANLTEFAGDPGWPGWPPPEGQIYPMGATLTAGLSGQLVNDFTYPAAYAPMTQYLNFGSNAAPVLSSCRIELDESMSLTPIAAYLDSDNNLPVSRLFHFNGDSFEIGSPDHVYSDSAAFEAALAWPSDGWHQYYFEFSDGGQTVQTVLDSILIGEADCTYIIGDINANGATNGIDVVYGVNYFKGGAPPPVSCDCPPGGLLYVAGDVNGNCAFNGIDVSYFVNYLKGGVALASCPSCPPGGMIAKAISDCRN